MYFHGNQAGNSSTNVSPFSKVVEFSKDVHLREIKLPFVGVIPECLLGPLEDRLVLIVEFEAFRYPQQSPPPR